MHGNIYMFQCYSLNSSHPLLTPLCPQICPFCLHLYSCPANGFISMIFLDSIYTCQYMIFFSFWITSLCITGSRFIHFIRTDLNVFFFMAELYSIVYMCHYFFIDSSVNEHLGGFHVLLIINSTRVNNGLHVYFWILLFSGYMPSSGIAGSYGSFIPKWRRDAGSIETIISRTDLFTDLWG